MHEVTIILASSKFAIEFLSLCLHYFRYQLRGDIKF